MFIDRLSHELNGKPLSHWQVAAEGIWEEAREIRPQAEAQNIASLLSWIESASQDIAIEAFFGDKQDQFFFFGLRIETLPKDRQYAFIQGLINDLSPQSSFADILQALKDKLYNERLLAGAPDFLELGAEGFWKSYGSYVVMPERAGSVATMQEIANNAPQLLEPFKRPIMMEFAWKAPLPMWLGIPISEKRAELYEFSEDRYIALSEAVSAD